MNDDSGVSLGWQITLSSVPQVLNTSAGRQNLESNGLSQTPISEAIDTRRPSAALPDLDK